MIGRAGYEEKLKELESLEKKAEYIIKPQTYEDLTRNDVMPERFNK